MIESSAVEVDAESNVQTARRRGPKMDREVYTSKRGVASAGEPASQGLVSPDRTLYAEDLTVGDVWTTEMRQVTADDVQEFANLTGDHTGLHGDQGSESPYGKPIAHGLLGLSILAGLGTNHPKASTLAFVSVEDWRFVAPVFLGDRVQARNEIVEIEPHGRRAVKVRWLRQLVNEAGSVVQEGYFVTLVASNARGRKKPR
ncbi:MaoC family dehydratase [Rhodopirellula sp. JC639]|uniref:MaoC family dehydratase n=1 Tax=Stieleria mannarensis TaxID=2755585 RepID=UPI001604489D|nr:MaoC/PaaZ C-terminal domain-containing protein [Rhodopirellula sp. JC639]